MSWKGHEATTPPILPWLWSFHAQFQRCWVEQRGSKYAGHVAARLNRYLHTCCCCCCFYSIPGTMNGMRRVGTFLEIPIWKMEAVRHERFWQLSDMMKLMSQTNRLQVYFIRHTGWAKMQHWAQPKALKCRYATWALHSRPSSRCWCYLFVALEKIMAQDTELLCFVLSARTDDFGSAWQCIIMRFPGWCVY